MVRHLLFSFNQMQGIQLKVRSDIFARMRERERETKKRANNEISKKDEKLRKQKSSSYDQRLRVRYLMKIVMKKERNDEK